MKFKLRTQNNCENITVFIDAKRCLSNEKIQGTIFLKDELDLKHIISDISFLSNISVVTESKESPLINDRTTYYICKNRACLPPTNKLSYNENSKR